MWTVRFPRILSAVELGVDAGVASGLVLMSGWSRSVRPLAAAQRGQSLLWYSLPVPAGRGASCEPRWTDVRVTDSIIFNRSRSSGVK